MTDEFDYNYILQTNWPTTDAHHRYHDYCSIAHDKMLAADMGDFLHVAVGYYPDTAVGGVDSPHNHFVLEAEVVAEEEGAGEDAGTCYCDTHGNSIQYVIVAAGLHIAY